LAAALELRALGVACRLVDQAPSRSDRSRALAVQARTLELLARHGVADALVERGRRTLDVALFVQKQPAAEVSFGDIGVQDSPYPFILFVSQVETERVLEAKVKELGVEVERPVEVTLVEALPDGGAGAQLRHADGTEERVHARYVVGADGAHSLVRKAAGMNFNGSAYPQDFMLADVEVQWDLPKDRVHFFLGDEAMVTVLPLQGHSRVVAVRPKHPTEKDPTLRQMEELLNSVSPVAASLENPTWLARFHLHHRGVDRYRQGPFFVAGDAAHIHSPVGGQGMNTGIQDAINLAWKLAYVLQGRAGEALLDSYHAERFPVGQRLLRRTDRFFSLVASANSMVIAARNFLAPRVVPWALKSPEQRRETFRFVSQLGINYRASPVVSESCIDMGDLLHPGLRAGDRVPDAHIRSSGGQATTLQSQLDPTRHTLLLFRGGNAGPIALKACSDRAMEFSTWITPVIVSRVPVEAVEPGMSVWLDQSGEAHERLGIRHPAHVLVRPDQYVAFRSSGLALEGVPLFLKRAYGCS
jgi:2-polyprenyl-6-methoxyphenol hydroxylase-like FAD-dependent oxidoreductase